MFLVWKMKTNAATKPKNRYAAVYQIFVLIYFQSQFEMFNCLKAPWQLSCVVIPSCCVQRYFQKVYGILTCRRWKWRWAQVRSSLKPYILPISHLSFQPPIRSCLSCSSWLSFLQHQYRLPSVKIKGELNKTYDRNTWSKKTVEEGLMSITHPKSFG